MKIEQHTKYLLASVNEQLFAIPSMAVVEITAETKPTKLPFVPHFISGLINANGNVIPLLNLSTYIYEGDPLPCKQVHIIIFSEASHFALSVDKAVDEVSTAECSANYYDRTIANEDMSEHVVVSGEINVSGRIAYILDMQQFKKIIPPSPENRGGGGLLGKVQQQEQGYEEMSLLVFQTLGERFGFSLNDVVEIIHVDAPIPIPGSPDCVEGLAMVRDDALLVLSFPVLLGKPAQTDAGQRLLVVIERENSHYGIDISSTVNIATFAKNNLVKSRKLQSQFTQVVINEQQQVTIVITSEELIPNELHYKLKELAPNVSSKDDDLVHTKQILHILINDLSYAFPLDYVRMVSPFHVITTVNDSGKNIYGIIDIEGRIVPVLDTGRRLGLIDFAKTQPQYVIIGDDTVEWAVPVTRVNQIIDVPEMDIEAIDSTELKHLSGIAHYQGQLIPLINPKELYASEH